MKTPHLIRVALFFSLAFILSACANPGAGKPQGMVPFKTSRFQLMAPDNVTLLAVMEVASFREDGAEIESHPTSKVANGLRHSINQFMGSLLLNKIIPEKVQAKPVRMSAEFRAKADQHTGSAMLSAGLQAGLTLGILGNNVTHHYSYHLDTVLTITRPDGQSRTYEGTADSKAAWQQQEAGTTGATALANAKAEAVKISLEAIAGKMTADKSFLSGGQ